MPHAIELLLRVYLCLTSNAISFLLPSYAPCICHPSLTAICYNRSNLVIANAKICNACSSQTYSWMTVPGSLHSALSSIMPQETSRTAATSSNKQHTTFALLRPLRSRLVHPPYPQFPHVCIPLRNRLCCTSLNVIIVSLSVLFNTVHDLSAHLLSKYIQVWAPIFQ